MQHLDIQFVLILTASVSARINFEKTFNLKVVVVSFSYSFYSINDYMIERWPWSSGHERRLVFKRTWVQIPTPDTFFGIN